MRRLVQKRSLRWSESVCVIEGPDLVAAALDAGLEFEGIYVDPVGSSLELNSLLDRARSLGVRVFMLEAGTIGKVADVQTPQPLIAAVRFTPVTLDQIDPHGLLVVLHDVRDPGNAGTVVRTAEAAGARAVILTGHCVDPYNPKTLRASAGALFQIPVVVAGELPELTSWYRATGGVSFAMVVRGGTDLHSVDLSGDVLIVVGNEGEGLTTADVAACDRTVTIAMSGASESLNVAVAAGITIFEAAYQQTKSADSVGGPNISTP